MNRHQSSITVHVQPNCHHNEVLGFRDGILCVKVGAPAIKGKANRELVKFLGQTLGVSKSSISIKGGLTSRNKVIIIDGLDRDQARERFECLGFKSE